MSEPGEAPFRLRDRWLDVLSATLFLVGASTVVLNIPDSWQKLTETNEWLLCLGGASAVVGGAMYLAMLARIGNSARLNESQARQRVRQAEDKLSDAIRGSVFPIDGVIHGDVFINTSRGFAADPGRPLDEADADDETFVQEQVTVEAKDDRLTLAALWDVTHSRMSEYHTIVTRQAKRSFGAAQFAMGAGFVLLVVFAILAVNAKTTTAAVTTGSLGAVSAALAAYIGKTFIRSQETAADHLRTYFDQPWSFPGTSRLSACWQTPKT